MRESHQEHFAWMEKKFSMKLRSDLPVFPKFIELCERRNLLTHTGGIISAKYIENCRASKVPLGSVEVGQKLTVDTKYYSGAVDVVCEIAIKLCWVLWRKFSKDERIEADNRLSEFCYELIVRRHYPVAEAILSFATKVLEKGGNDSCRRRMLVNLANAIRLQERQAEAHKILDNEDWSAGNDEFAVSVAAVKGDIDAVVRLMTRIGPNSSPNIEDYRSWPVFRGLRSHARFRATFLEVFGVPLVLPDAKPDPQLRFEVPQMSAREEVDLAPPINNTKH